MAQGYTRTISDPDVSFGSVSPGGASVGGAIGGALAGLAHAADSMLKVSSANRERDTLNSVDNALFPEIQAYAGQNTPPLLGESTDTEKEAATSSPTYQKGVSDLNRLSSSHEQGKMSSEEFFAKTAAIVQRMKNENPRFSQQIEQEARTILGVSPTAEQVTLQAKDQAWYKEQQQNIQQSWVNAAAGAGVGYFKEDGSLDIDRTARAGREILQSTANIKALNDEVNLKKSQLELQKAQQGGGKELTLDETRDIETRSFLKYSNPVYNEQVASALSHIPQLVQQAGSGLSGEKQKAFVAQQIGLMEANYMNWLNGQLNNLDKPLSTQSADAIRGYYKAQFDTYRTMFGGSLDVAQTTARALSTLKNQANLDMHETAPIIAQLNDTVGPNAIATTVNTAISESTSTRQTIDKELVDMIQQGGKPLTAGDHIRNAAAVSAGRVLIGNLPPEQQKGALRTSLAAYDNYIQRPNELNDKELFAYGNLASNIVTMGLNGSPQDVTAAAAHTNTPAAWRTFDRFYSSSQDNTKATLLARGTSALNVKSIQSQLANFKPVAGQALVPNDNIYMAAASANKTEGFQWMAVYNPQTGRMEITNDSKSTNPGNPPTQMVKAVQSTNASLDTIAHYRKYGNDQQKALNDRQLKQLVMTSMGVKLKDGVAPVPMPNEGGKQSANNPFDLIHKIQNKIESNNNPNAVSKKGAKGINQVMDATNLDPGYGVTPARDNSPQERERVGRDYIDALIKNYRGNVAYALAAYNWGPGNVDKWIAKGANWEELPQETQDYLSRALLESRKAQVALSGGDNASG